MIDLHAEILNTNGQPQFAVLPYDEFVELKTTLARLIEKEVEDPRYGSFYDNLSTEELAGRQGVRPVTDSATLAWPYGPEDWDGFEEAVQEWRHGAGIQ